MLTVNHLIGFGRAKQDAPPTGGGAPALVLDGLSPTGAWSMSRDLLSAFVGGSRYADTAGAITSINDQSGNSRHLTDSATATRRPAVATQGPNSVTCANFDGSSDFLSTTATLADFIAAASGYIVCSVIIDNLTRNFANARDNHPIVGGTSATPSIGLYGRLLSGTTPTVYAHNRDASDDQPAGATISLGTAYVLEWRHEGGNIYLRVNGGTETSVASGNTGSLIEVLQLAGGSTVRCDMDFFEMAVFSTVPSSGDRNAIVADFMAHIGI